MPPPKSLPETPEVETAFRTLVRAAARELGLNGDRDTLAERHGLAADMIVSAVLGADDAKKRHDWFSEHSEVGIPRSRRPLPDTPEVNAALDVLMRAAQGDRDMVVTYVFDASVDEFIDADLDLDRTDRHNPRAGG